MEETREVVQVEAPLEVRQDFVGTPAELARPRAGKIFEGRAARVHRPGDGLKYKHGEEFRDEAELAAIQKLVVGKPMTLLHPDPSPENKHGMVTLGAEGHIAGEVLSARVDGDWLVIKFLVDDAESIEAIEENGWEQLSLQYACRSDARGYQRNTRVDSVAIVPRGRCGGSCALRADQEEVRQDCGCHEVSDRPVIVEDAGSACACARLADSLVVRHPATHMPEDLQKQLADALAENAVLKARADAADATASAEKTRADKFELEAYNAKKDLETRADAEKVVVEAAVAAEKVRADQAEALVTEKDAEIAKIRADHAASTAKAVEERVSLLAQVAPMNLEFRSDKDEPVAIHNVAPRDIKLAAIKLVDNEDLSLRSDEWVDAIFFSAMNRYKPAAAAAAQSRADAEEAVAEMREKADPSKPDSLVSKAAITKTKNAQRAQLAAMWKTPTDKKDQ